jgi:uncharacterized protein YllA (UPF0747 family)
MTNPLIEKAITKKNWTLKDLKNSKDPIDRLVWFISIQSPHNLWRGYEAIITQLEVMEREVRKEHDKINHNIDVRYEDDIIKAFNKFIEKWCGSHFPHLIDTDENDGEYMREKIRELSQSNDHIKKVLNYAFGF